MLRKFVSASIISLLFLLIPTYFVFAKDRGCNITDFSMNPGGTVFNMGDVIGLEGKSTCGTVRFEIDREPKSEIGTTSQSMNMNTTEFGAGQHDVCFVARGEGGWEEADRRCVKITIKENKPKCQITSFGYSPKKDVYTLGDVVDFSGQSTCGTVQYSVEGKTVSELGSTNLNYQFKTGEWGKETYTVCFLARGDGGWESADRRCGTIFVGTDPGLPPVYPDEPDNGSGDSNQEGQDACKINNFTVNPRSANPGDVITLSGSGNCEEGGPRAVRFTIDGKVKDELGAPSLTATWNTSGYSNGTHRVCFQVVKYDWEYAVSQCLNVKLGQGTGGSEAGNTTNCKGDHATLVEDLSIPDGTKMLPGEIFTKSWRIKNDGNCVWNRNYYFSSLGGEKMGGKVNNIPGTVSPGETIDFSLELHAPTEPGTYKSYWGLIDPKKNQLKSRVFVLIEVTNSIQSEGNPGDNTSGEKRSMDILGYCESRGYTGAYANDKDNARSWVCQRTGDLTFVNFDDACKFTNGEEFAKAVIQDEKNPNSWYCEKKTKKVTPTLQYTEDNKQTYTSTKPDEYYFSFGHEPKSNYSYDLSMMRCDENSQILQDDLSALMESKFWPKIIEQAINNKVSFSICDFIFPDKNYQTIVKVEVDPSLNFNGGEAKYDKFQLKINSSNYFKTLNLFNKKKGAAILGHEIQHFIDNGYEQQKYLNLSYKEKCELLPSRIRDSFIFEVRGYAIEEAIYNDSSKDGMTNNDYLEIMNKKKIEDNYKNFIMDFYNNELNNCQKEGYLLNKNIYIQYDTNTGFEEVELK